MDLFVSDRHVSPSLPTAPEGGNLKKKSGIGLVVAAIGVVFGDIGTSPLYTLKEIFSVHYGLVGDHDTVLGVLSLIFWALILVVTVKYVTVIMNADNDGEGGIMALMALSERTLARGSRAAYAVGALGIFGASLFFGDGVITPAVSVMGAVEGLGVAEPQLVNYIVPVGMLVLLLLFVSQRFGTARVGKVFGPIMSLWFVAIAIIGIYNIGIAPEVLKAFNPLWGARFFIEHGSHGILIFGAVILAVTGGEALYADMGHFGARPIRYAWYFFVLPCLLLNYLGQGALILAQPEMVQNPFYEAVPRQALMPMIVLATLAATIASQAVITGAFSVTRQAIQLGYIPRMYIRHTSKDTIGQIYIPAVNWTLMVLVLALVLTFRNSSNLSVAYGLSVSCTMLIDTVLLALVAWSLWPRWRKVILPLCALFFVIELAFVIANGNKLLVSAGAWFPVVLGTTLFILMRSWRSGREVLSAEIHKNGIGLSTFLSSLKISPPVRVPGTAVFLTGSPDMAPRAMMHNLKHNRVLHERNIFLTVVTQPVPFIADDKRLEVVSLGDEFYRMTLWFGFMENPDVPEVLLPGAEAQGIHLNAMETTYFVGYETVTASNHRFPALWRDRLFAVMHRNATPVTVFFQIPGNRLVQLGTRIEI